MTENEIEIIRGVFYSPEKDIISISFPKGCSHGCYCCDCGPCAFCDSLASHFASVGTPRAMGYTVKGSDEEFFGWYYQWMLGANAFPTDEEVAESILKNDNTVFEDSKAEFLEEFKKAYLEYKKFEDGLPQDWLPSLLSDLMGIKAESVKKLAKKLFEEEK
jgi:hypothetical protein